MNLSRMTRCFCSREARTRHALLVFLTLGSSLMASCEADDDPHGSGGTSGATHAGGATQSGGAAHTAGTAHAAGTTAHGEAGAGGEEHGTLAPVMGDRRVPFTPPNDAAFAEFFIEHHQMALEMAEHVIAHGERSDVRDIAENIVTTQAEEIQLMRAALAELPTSALPPSPSDPHAESEMHHMMSMSGAALDEMFLIDMIAHHASGLPVAHRSLDIIDRSDLRELADSMARAQAREIGSMQEILNEMSVEHAGEDLAEATSGRPDFGLIGDRRVPLTPADDLEFIDFFVPHHEMAVEMARHVVGEGESEEVRSFAEAIIRAQTEEIETMQKVRSQLAPLAEALPIPHDRHMMSEMDAIMASRGSQLDLMFLEEMIPHHAAGIPTAHRARPHVQNAELRAMADNIFQTQAEEIGRMQTLLER